MAITVGAVLSDSFRQVLKDFWTFLATQGVFVVASAALSLLVTAVAFPLVARDMVALIEGSPGLGDIAVGVVNFVAALVTLAVLGTALGLLGTAVGVVVADALRGGRRLGLVEAWAVLSPRLGNVSLTILAAVGALLGGILALALGGFFLTLVSPLMLILVFLAAIAFVGLVVVLSLSWALILPASLFERHDVVENFRRSTRLMRGSRGILLGASILVGLVVFVPSAIVSVAFAPDPVAPEASSQETLAAAQGDPLEQVIQVALLLPFQLVSAFLVSAMLVRFYRGLAHPEPVPGALPP